MGLLDGIEKFSGYHFTPDAATSLADVQLTGFQRQKKELHLVEPGSAPDPETVAVIKTTTTGIGSTSIDYVPLTKYDLEQISILTKRILQE